jgi:DNA primase
LFSPPAAGDRPERDWSKQRFSGGRLSSGRTRGFAPGARPSPREALRPLSSRLGGSALVRGYGLPAREALILRTVVNHPWLMEKHAEELAELEFRNSDADRLRGALLDAAAHGGIEADAFAATIAARDLKGVLARVEATLTHHSDWPAEADAAPEDVARWWTHVVTLHRKSRTLNRELKDAERALGTEPSDENFAWLRDVQERLAALDGAEAEIEGFGASSGRSGRTI